MTSHRHRKHAIRVLAVEDGPFSRADRRCSLLGVVTKDGSIESVFLDEISVDGTDATKKVVSIARRSGRVNLIVLPSVSFGGFNIVDPYKLHRQLKLPVVVANPQKPRVQAVQDALKKHFLDWRRRVGVFQMMGSPSVLRVGREGTLYFYSIGLTPAKTRSILRDLIYFGKRVEPLRIARILARALASVPPLKAARRI